MRRTRLWTLFRVMGALGGLVLLGSLVHPRTRGMLLAVASPRAQIARLESLAAFRDAFNARTDTTRVVAWLSPT